MSATPLRKINDRLMPFIVADMGSSEHGQLDDLDVFHTRFSSVVDKHQGVTDEPEKTYEQGLEEGRLSAQNEAMQQIETTAALVQSLHENLAALGTQIQASHSRAITTILRAVLPRLAEQAAGVEIRGFLDRIAGQALQGEVTLSVNPSFENSLADITQTLIANGGGAPDFTIVTDDNMNAHAVSATWSSGGGAIDIDAAVQECLTLITPIDAQ